MREPNRSASGKLSLLQKEYNAIPFFDKWLHQSLLVSSNSIYLMNGKQKQYYVKANSEYKIELVSALSDNGAGDVIETFTPFYEAVSNRSLRWPFLCLQKKSGKL